MAIFSLNDQSGQHIYLKSRNQETLSLTPMMPSLVYIQLGEQSRLSLDLQPGDYQHSFVLILTKGSQAYIQERESWSGNIDWNIYLIEPYTELEYKARVKHFQEQRSELEIQHQASYTTSKVDCRYSSHTTDLLHQHIRITIPQAIQHCQAFQSTEVLLTQDCRPHLSIIPELQVANDQNQASHGVSVHPIADLEVFYLMARGLSLKRARQMIELGFLNPQTI